MIWDGAKPSVTHFTPNFINVFAGNDRTICSGQSLTISALNANISGDVSDGDWVSFGDGRFQPGNLMTVRYSVAQSGNISYQPGPNDITLGFYRLMLMSDPPMGGTPQERVTDEVRISFQHAPPLFCASNINVSLNERCEQLVTAQMLSPNAVPPFNNYIITLYDDKNRVIPNNLLNTTHLDMLITYRLGHQCTSNICWGNLRVEDYFPPQFECRNDTISCRRSTSPDSLGFPIPARAVVDTFINGKYIVSNWDYCSKVELTFTETSQKADCTRDEDRTITRRWTAKDAKGNTSTCTQLIVVKRISLSQVVFPPNFNDIDAPSFSCQDTFPVLANGHPSPDTTGMPSTIGCGHLQNTMTDVVFDLCGAGYKLARSWFVIDWCSTLSVTRNQIIEIKDKTGPIINCLDTLRLNADAYECRRSSAPIPALTSVVDCSDFQIQYTLFNEGNQVVNFIHSSGTFQNIPVGTFRLRYTVTDECSNASICDMTVIVEDKTTPFPACKAFVKVSLGVSGTGRVFASSYDNNSLDNCGIDKVEARKMSNACGPINAEFTNHLDFCCTEMGQSVMVEVRITDIYGNANTCMVETQVEDKLPPQIVCLPDISIHCTDYYDINDLSAFGRVVTKEADRRSIVINNKFHNGPIGIDGLATDNCSVTVTERVEEHIDCHVGHIKRIFIATDPAGHKDSCTQTIFVVNDNPFTAQDIVWPSHYTGGGCRVDQLPPLITGSPTYRRQDCANLASTFTDQLFFSQDSACLKIIREWYVVDWCQFNDNTLTGRWGPYFQTIKAHNHTAPTFDTPCRDTVFCSYDADCQKGRIQLLATGSDDCSRTSDLVWMYSVDIKKNGTIDLLGQTHEFSGDLPLGTHSILWRVSDPCGNFSECRYDITVVDCKKPTPYCISSLTMSIDAVTEDAEIWAIDFDNGSTDNCADVSNLVFTFNEAHPVQDSINKSHYFKVKGISATKQEYDLGQAQRWIPTKRSSALRFTCKDIPDGVEEKITVRMSVIEPNGLMDFCDVELILQDNNSVCPDLKSSLRISGEISTTNGQIPQDVELTARTGEMEYLAQLDERSGTYVFEDLPLESEYLVEAYNDADVIQGVTTLDILTIQRHLLDITPFHSPYQFIAADANNSGSITAADLVSIRRLILGMIDTYPNNTPSWKFIPAENGFNHENNPFSYTTVHQTNVLSDDLPHLNFVGVKIGDTNFSFRNLLDEDIDVRSKSRTEPHFLYSIDIKDNRQQLVIRAGKDMWVDGWQLFLNIPGLISAEQVHLPLSQGVQDTHSDQDILHSIKYYESAVEYTSGSVVAVFDLVGSTDMNNIHLRQNRRSEIYFNNLTQKIGISAFQRLDRPTVLLKSNPVVGELRFEIKSHTTKQYNYNILTSDGKMVQSGHIFVEGNINEYSIRLPQNCPTGLMVIQINDGTIQESFKFIVVK